jgi:hypothetical protein
LKKITVSVLDDDVVFGVCHNLAGETATDLFLEWSGR